MRRLTISLDEPLAEEFDSLVDTLGYGNRSEAYRDLLRKELEERRVRGGGAPFCVANVSYVYNHHKRELSSRLAAIQHDHHDLVLATTHAHLDHHDCIETVLLRGPTAKVVELAESIVAETGVRHGKINLIPVDIDIRHARQGGLHITVHPKS